VKYAWVLIRGYVVVSRILVQFWILSFGVSLLSSVCYTCS